MLCEQGTKTALKRAPPSHGRVTSDKKDNVFGHKTEDGVDVTCGGCAVPERDESANGLFVGVQLILRKTTLSEKRNASSGVRNGSMFAPSMEGSFR